MRHCMYRNCRDDMGLGFISGFLKISTIFVFFKEVEILKNFRNLRNPMTWDWDLFRDSWKSRQFSAFSKKSRFWKISETRCFKTKSPDSFEKRENYREFQRFDPTIFEITPLTNINDQTKSLSTSRKVSQRTRRSRISGYPLRWPPLQNETSHRPRSRLGCKDITTKFRSRLPKHGSYWTSNRAVTIEWITTRNRGIVWSTLWGSPITRWYTWQIELRSSTICWIWHELAGSTTRSR